jgi:cobalt/nickel transport system permease protein
MCLALLLCLKALTVVTLILVLLATAPLQVSLQAAQSLRVPRIIVLLVQLTYRYVFLLMAELGRMRLALRVRGFRRKSSWHIYRTVGHVAGVLLVRGAERAERVSQAMRCRGFQGRFHSLAEFHTARKDLLSFFLIVGCAAALAVLDRFP